MPVVLVVPEGVAASLNAKEILENSISLRQVPQASGYSVSLEYSKPEITTVVVISDPEAISPRSLRNLISQSRLLTQTQRAIAFIPGSGSRPVLATGAVAYAFNGLALHLAGGLDTQLPISAIGLDAQFRLAGRAVESVAIGCSEIVRPAQIPLSSYLKVLSKNVTSTLQAGYLAPLFAGIVNHSLRLTDTDCSTLDLQRSPGGDHELSLGHAAGAFEGAQIVRDWSLSLESIKTGKLLSSRSRRIPDRRLPYFDLFIDEIWQATGIDSTTRESLECAFSDVISSNLPEVTFCFCSADERATKRAESIAAQLTEPISWWDPDTRSFRQKSDPDSDWQLSSASTDEMARASCIAYSIGLQAREIPWIQNSPSILITDFTTVEIVPQVKSDWVGYADNTSFAGPAAGLFAETILRADIFIVDSVCQRDFLLGALSAVLRINPYTYDEDPSLSTLISIEDGVQAALASIAHPIRPFEHVLNTAEYERSPYALADEGSLFGASALTKVLKKTGSLRRGSKK